MEPWNDGPVCTLRNSWPTAPVTPTMAMEGAAILIDLSVKIRGET